MFVPSIEGCLHAVFHGKMAKLTTERAVLSQLLRVLSIIYLVEEQPQQILYIRAN